MRSSLRNILLFAAPFALSAYAGCSGCGGATAIQDNSDVFGNPEVATEPSEMDSQSSSFVWARPTSAVVFCVQQPCPTYQVRAVDGGETKFVHQFDLRALGLSQSEQQTMNSKMGTLLTRGKFVKSRFQGKEITVYQVTRALQPASTAPGEQPVSDNYYNVRVNGACKDDKCVQWLAKPLKAGQTQNWERMDLSHLGLSGEQEEALLIEMRSRGGYVSASGAPTGIPVLTQVFHAQ